MCRAVQERVRANVQSCIGGEIEVGLARQGTEIERGTVIDSSLLFLRCGRIRDKWHVFGGLAAIYGIVFNCLLMEMLPFLVFLSFFL